MTPFTLLGGWAGVGWWGYHRSAKWPSVCLAVCSTTRLRRKSSEKERKIPEGSWLGTDDPSRSLFRKPPSHWLYHDRSLTNKVKAETYWSLFCTRVFMRVTCVFCFLQMKPPIWDNEMPELNPTERQRDIKSERDAEIAPPRGLGVFALFMWETCPVSSKGFPLLETALRNDVQSANNSY